jgi:GRAB domain
MPSPCDCAMVYTMIGVIMNEHLVEALRRLRKNSSETNVDRRLVTNIVLSFITTPRGDTKRFEMLNLLSSILSWGDAEREKAGLQKQQQSSGGGGGVLSPPAATGFWGRSLSSGGQSASVFKTPDIAKSDETEVCVIPSPFSFHSCLLVLTPTYSPSRDYGSSSCSQKPVGNRNRNRRQVMDRYRAVQRRRRIPFPLLRVRGGCRVIIRARRIWRGWRLRDSSRRVGKGRRGRFWVLRRLLLLNL